MEFTVLHPRKFELVAYAKDIEPRSFYRNLDESLITKFREIVKSSGYDVTDQIIQIITSRQKTLDLQWVTLTGNCLEETRFSTDKDLKKKTHRIEKYYGLYDNEVIKKHLFADKLRNNTCHKWFRGFNISEYGFAAHKLNKTTIGFSIKRASDVIIVDIDAHDDTAITGSAPRPVPMGCKCRSAYLIKNKSQNTIKAHKKCDRTSAYNTLIQLLEDIEYKGVYLIERSVSGGYHVYIKVDQKLCYEQKQEFANSFNDTYKYLGYKIEVPERIRVPFSLSYQSIRIDEWLIDFKQPNCYASKIDAINDTYALQHSVKCLPYKSLKKLYCLEKEFVLDLYKNESWEVEYTSLYQRSNSKHYSKECFEKKLLNDEKYMIYAGNRNQPMLSIIRDGSCRGFDVNELVSIIRKNDNGSKDLSRWSDDKLKDTVEVILNNWDKKYIPKQKKVSCINDYFDNSHLIPDELKSLARNEFIIDEILKKLPFKKDNKKNKTREIISLLMIHIFGKFVYDSNNKRSIAESFKFDDKKKKDLLTGIQISRKELRLFCKAHRIYNAHIEKIYNAITSILFDQFKHDEFGYNYILHYCKQFIFKNSKSYYNVYKNIKFNFIKILLSFKNVFNPLYIFKLYSILKLFYCEVDETESLGDFFQNVYDTG